MVDVAELKRRLEEIGEEKVRERLAIHSAVIYCV